MKRQPCFIVHHIVSTSMITCLVEWYEIRDLAGVHIVRVFRVAYPERVSPFRGDFMQTS